MAKRHNKKSREKVAKKHIDSLFSLLKDKRHSDYKTASRYLWLIRRVAMKNNYSLSSTIKRSYCKHCKALFLPGKNARVRVQRKKVIYYCFNCKKFTRIPYSKKK